MSDDLEQLRHTLAEVEAQLPRPDSSNHTECDDWCKLWMLLVGAHYSLAQAQGHLSASPLHIELRRAHQYAVTLLSSHKAPAGGATWSAGYFLISAEHRLADALDRLTGLAAALPGRSDVYLRLQLLARRWPECCRHRFSDECQRVLTSKNGALLRVHQRVNVLKHHAKETKINKVSTTVRFSDATKALQEATILIREFASHARECTARSARGCTRRRPRGRPGTSRGRWAAAAGEPQSFGRHSDNGVVMGKKEYQPDHIDPVILPLVDLLNELEHVETAVSCEGHGDQWWSSRRPVVTFFVRCRPTDGGDFLFPSAALRQLSALAWILSRTFCDGFFPIPDQEHVRAEPLAWVTVQGEPPGADREETPRWSSPISLVLKLQDKDAVPLLVNALKANWADLRDRRGAAAYDEEEAE